jgi:hypothetical protein
MRGDASRCASSFTVADAPAATIGARMSLLSADAVTPPEPMTKGTILHALVGAVRETWGEPGIRAIVDRLPPATAEATPGLVPIVWYPTRYLLEWNAALMDGPAQGDENAFRRCVARSIDLGFGRVRRAFLVFATPKLLAKRAADLWRHDHTHGTLTRSERDLPPRTARFLLEDHLFVKAPVDRLAIAEVLRHVLSLSHANDVRETHAMQGNALAITLRWGERDTDRA